MTTGPDPDAHRPRPARLARLPEQYFKGILAQAEAAAAAPGAPFIDLGRGNPDLPPP
ncbi:MAG: aminotransferase class I/II-fold pyridoxal phosphate-dependent enzyme, partial [Conexibacter sp.]|nr:aminotransferase class I/II-fold pyridoxal phosphate-dependent enzyme [Conexibacter sp.]